MTNTLRTVDNVAFANCNLSAATTAPAASSIGAAAVEAACVGAAGDAAFVAAGDVSVAATGLVLTAASSFLSGYLCSCLSSVDFSMLTTDRRNGAGDARSGGDHGGAAAASVRKNLSP